MYLSHFNLGEFPFALTPDTQFYFRKKSHQDCMDFLNVCIDGGEGFVKIIGEIGTGKTLMCRYLINTLSEEYETAYIPNPFISPIELKMMLADELGIEYSGEVAENALLSLIHHKLVALANNGKRLVVVIDEAQAMPRETLEALRLISNFETEKQKLLTIVLVGQPELDILLARKELRQLRQRIVFSYKMKPIQKNEIARYVYYRLEKTGYHRRNPFTRGALKLLYYATGGVPRLINSLCHKSLLLAYGDGHPYVDTRTMLKAILDGGDNYLMNSRLSLLMRQLWWPVVAGLSTVSLLGIYWQVAS